MRQEQGARKQIEVYRGMSGMERLKIAFEMWEMALEQVRSSERSLHPELSGEEMERRVRKRMTDGAVGSH